MSDIESTRASSGRPVCHGWHRERHRTGPTCRGREGRGAHGCAHSAAVPTRWSSLRDRHQLGSRHAWRRGQGSLKALGPGRGSSPSTASSPPLEWRTSPTESCEITTAAIPHVPGSPTRTAFREDDGPRSTELRW